jgi:hypothetical protein
MEFALHFDRRRAPKLGVVSALASTLPARLLRGESGPQQCSPPVPQKHAPANGGTCPYPIPWLDNNGNHNQSPMANVELSNIYHFKGKLARCNGLHGMGTDKKGNHLAWARRPPISATWRANTGPLARRTRPSIRTPDLRVFQGPAVPANQIHDFHPPISPEGLYWAQVGKRPRSK